MDDRRAALLLACLALAGAGVRHFFSPSPNAPPGDVQLQSTAVAQPGGLRETARRAAQLARPLLPGERIDIDSRRRERNHTLAASRSCASATHRCVAHRTRPIWHTQPARQRAGRGCQIIGRDTSFCRPALTRSTPTPILVPSFSTSCIRRLRQLPRTSSVKSSSARG